MMKLRIRIQFLSRNYVRRKSCLYCCPTERRVQFPFGHDPAMAVSGQRLKQQPLKGASDFEELTASLKRCPDTKLKRCPGTKRVVFSKLESLVCKPSFISAVNRCATQNQMQQRLASPPVYTIAAVPP